MLQYHVNCSGVKNPPATIHTHIFSTEDKHFKSLIPSGWILKHSPPLHTHAGIGLIRISASADSDLGNTGYLP